MSSRKGKRGRAGHGPRPVLQFRVHDDLYQRLREEAATRKLTLSQVAESILVLRFAPTKRRGRPTNAALEGARVPLGLRVTADIKTRLDQAAVASGRSQSHEAEFRLERSFDREALLLEILSTLRKGK